MLFDYLFFRLNFKILVVGGRPAPHAAPRALVRSPPMNLVNQTVYL